MSSDGYRDSVFNWTGFIESLTFQCSTCDTPMAWEDRWLVCKTCGAEDPPYCLTCTDTPQPCPECAS